MAVGSPFPTRPDSMAQLYDDLPVSARCIRLVRVNARDRRTSEDVPLRCELFVADLATTPMYTALSYVWGQFASPPQIITCNDIPIPVTTSCYSALQHLRAVNGSFTIWIDAICINQSDQLDKAQQIDLMGEIYSQAQASYIWLGEADDATNRVMRYLGRIGFLKQFYEDGDTREQIRKDPRVWGSMQSYVKGRWGLGPSVLPFPMTGKVVLWKYLQEKV